MKGWLDKYQDGGVAKTDATRVAAPNLKLTKAQLDKNKAINKQVMVNTEKANAKKLAQRKKGIAESSDADIINPNGKRFAIGDMFRMFPNDVSGVGEMFDDFINPAVFVGNTASGLGNAMIDRDAGAFATEAGIALGAGALGFDPLGNSVLLESGKEFLSLYKNLSKSKNLNELGQSFFGIPPEKILPRLSKEDLKIYRQVQDIGRMRSMNKPISEQYKFALDQGIPEEHLQKIFKKSKSEIENIIPTTQEREAFRLANPIRLNLERPPRQSTSITERDDIVRNAVSDYDIDRILNQLPPPPEEIIMNDQSFFLGSTTYKNANLSKGINSIPTKLVSSLISHPTYTGEVLEKVPSLYLNNSGTLKNVSDKVFTRSSSGINSGDVFTGSLNTSHNSYIPQLKQVFKYKGGAPQFLGYRPMNSLGYLSEYGYSHKDIAKYLNTEIDEQVNRKIIPENIQRPYIQGEHVLLPHYGIKEFKDGGWLEKYNDGGPIQPNYNDYSVSAGPGFEGDGYSNVGRNYSPAWGGQFQMGGSIGGATQGIPGATGFMYARVAGSTPSKGKDRNKVYKTDASAENGKEMKFYQEGLDFKPKSISKNGSVIKDDMGQWAHPGEITEIGSNQITMQGVPYPVMGISDTGDMQMMYPNKEYQYDGDSVTEYPMMAQGGQLTKLDQLTNFTNYNTKQPGGWLDKYQ
jgi:hypothetical protein